MVQNLQRLFSDQTILRISWFFAASILVDLGVTIWKWNSLPPQLPLFYSLPRGEEQLGTPFFLLLLPGLSLVFFCINMFIASMLHTKERLAGVLLILVGTITSILLTVSYLNIVFLIT